MWGGLQHFIPSAPKYLLLGLPVRGTAFEKMRFFSQYSSKILYTWASTKTPCWTAHLKHHFPETLCNPSLCEVCLDGLTLAKEGFQMQVWLSGIGTLVWTKFYFFFWIILLKAQRRLQLLSTMFHSTVFPFSWFSFVPNTLFVVVVVKLLLVLIMEM